MCIQNEIMEKISRILFITLLIFNYSVHAQLNMIKYENNIVLDETEIENALINEQDSFLKEDTTFINLKNFAIQMAERFSPYISTYYFNDTLIRYSDNDIDSDSKNFYLIDPSNSMWTRYYTDKNGIIKFSKTKFKSSEDWKLEYTISIDKTDKKIILGYDCYKVKIVENRESIMDGWIDGCTYECYVTDELNLPFNCTELIWERILDKTALEIVYYLNNLPMSKEYKKAIEIKTGVDNDFIKLPIYYQHAIKAK